MKLIVQRAIVSASAWNVLGALAVGIRIREFSDGWRAVGPWQEPSSSGIDSRSIEELLAVGYAERETLGIGRYAAITKTGEEILSAKLDQEVRTACEWIRDHDLVPTQVSGR